MRKRIILEQDDLVTEESKSSSFFDGFDTGIPIAIRMFVVLVIVLIVLLYITK